MGEIIPFKYNIPVEVPETLTVPSWEEWFFRKVYITALKSKSLTTKIGAVLVDWEEKDDFSFGYNGLPRGVNDEIPARMNDRTERSNYDCHAELSSILNCARRGQKTKGSYMFTNAMPCNLCAVAIIQAGIKKVVFHKQWNEITKKTESWKKWIDKARYSHQMFQEAHIEIEEFNCVLGMKGFLDGKVIQV
jgi:dCMP deaminase